MRVLIFILFLFILIKMIVIALYSSLEAISTINIFFKHFDNDLFGCLNSRYNKHNGFCIHYYQRILLLTSDP